MNLTWLMRSSGHFDDIDEVSGVYIIAIRQNNDFYKVIYVGKASNLKIRANNHWSTYEPNVKLKGLLTKNYDRAVYIFADVGREEDRSGIELYLYKYYSPCCNENEPPATREIIVNLPMIINK